VPEAKRPQRPTIKDVARLAGLSLGTTSRALNAKKGVSEESARRVSEAARELGFQIDARARSLRSDRSLSIGVLLSDIRNPFFAEIARAIERVALREGYVTLLANADESVTQQDTNLRGMVSQRVDGLVVAPQGDGSGSLRSIVESRLPVVFVDRTIEGLAVPSVVSDAEPGLRAALEHLAELGHARVGFIGGPMETSTGRDRRAIFLAETARIGLDDDPGLIVDGDFQFGSGGAGATYLMGLSSPPTALVTADNLMGIGALRALQEMGVRIGVDVGLIAFDDLPWAELLSPSLTVISQDVEALGRISAELLLEAIHGGHPKSVVVPTQLVIRESSEAFGARRQGQRQTKERS